LTFSLLSRLASAERPPGTDRYRLVDPVSGLLRWSGVL